MHEWNKTITPFACILLHSPFLSLPFDFSLETNMEHEVQNWVNVITFTVAFFWQFVANGLFGVSDQNPGGSQSIISSTLHCDLSLVNTLDEVF